MSTSRRSQSTTGGADRWKYSLIVTNTPFTQTRHLTHVDAPKYWNGDPTRIKPKYTVEDLHNKLSNNEQNLLAFALDLYKSNPSGGPAGLFKLLRDNKCQPVADIYESIVSFKLEQGVIDNQGMTDMQLLFTLTVACTDGAYESRVLTSLNVLNQRG